MRPLPGRRLVQLPSVCSAFPLPAPPLPPVPVLSRALRGPLPVELLRVPESAGLPLAPMSLAQFRSAVVRQARPLPEHLLPELIPPPLELGLILWLLEPELIPPVQRRQERRRAQRPE